MVSRTSRDVKDAQSQKDKKTKNRKKTAKMISNSWQKKKQHLLQCTTRMVQMWKSPRNKTLFLQ
jgi:hypothetical protein